MESKLIHFLELNISGGNDYVWLSHEISGITDSILTINPDTTSLYYVRANGVNGCFVLDSVKVTVNSLPQIGRNKSTSVFNAKCRKFINTSRILTIPKLASTVFLIANDTSETEYSAMLMYSL